MHDLRSGSRRRRRLLPTTIAGFTELLLIGGLNRPAHAIIVMRNPGRNVSPPRGKELAGSGWQYEGDWHGFTGTAIGPHSFITATHVGGFPGEAFVLDGVNYRAIDATTLPGTDLCVWRVAGTLPLWAALYTRNAEVGRDIVMFGRGTDRGAPIRVGGAIHGWQTSGADARLSWGRSWVAAAIPAQTIRSASAFGDGLAAPFDADAGPDAGGVSSGDSGGGVFLKDEDGQWKLAGVIYGVETGFYSSADPKNSISGAIFDSRGLYRQQAKGKIVLVPTDAGDAYAMNSLISRISPHAREIENAAHALRTTVRLRRLALLVLGPAIVVCGGIGVALWRFRRRGSVDDADADEATAIDTDP